MGTLLPLGRALADGLLWPFMRLPPLWGLVLLSVVCGVVLLLAFRLLTPQGRLAVVKDRMSATIYEMRLYNAQPLRVLRAQGRAIGLTGAYLGLALPSFVVLVPVVGLLLVRASLLFEFAPLPPNEPALVSVELSRALPRAQLTVGGSEGLSVLPPVLHLEGGKRLELRVRAARPGSYALTVAAGGAKETKTVEVGGAAAVSLERTRAGDWSLLLGDEPPLGADSPVSRIAVAYPDREPIWLGLPWYVHLLIISMIAAFALRRRLGVVF